MKITKIPKRFLRILITEGDNINNFFLFSEKKENKIELNTKKIIFDETMVKIIIVIIKISIEYVKKTTNDEMVGEEKEKKVIEAMVTNFVNKCSYEPIPMIHFINQIFIRILAGHYFINGNKRIAIMTLRNVLLWSGYYLKFSTTYTLMNLKIYKEICEKFTRQKLFKFRIGRSFKD